MQFNSFIFLFFITLVSVLYYLVPPKLRNYLLLLSNYLFYFYFDFVFAMLLFVLTSITYFLGNKINDSTDHGKKRNLVVFAVVINILALAFFKYFNFFTESFISLLNLLGFNNNLFTLKILLPLGISFYIFQTLSYILDIYYETLEVKSNFVEYAVFASFFPTIVAGPIERASRLLPQIKSQKEFKLNNIKEGTYLIIIGLFRKVLIGDACGKIVNHIFADPQYYSSIEVFTAVILYTFQIYNDFAGYSSMARGVAKLLGFDIFINFRQPYFATSVADFWRRWHISLSLWLKDYLFVPLQMKYRRYRMWGNIIAMMITFTLCGFWHGASWTFIFWGFLHGFYMSFALLSVKQKQYFKKLMPNKKSLTILQAAITFFLITFAWIFFRAENFSNAFLIIEKLFEFSTGEFAFRFIKILFMYLSVSFLLDYMEYKWDTDIILLKLKPSVRYAISVAILFIVFAYLITSDKAPFIYAQF